MITCRTVASSLVGEGRIRLDDPIERWLPGVVTGNGNDGRYVSVRQLLQHTSGLYDATGDLAAPRSADEFLAHRFDHYTEAQQVATAMRHAPLFVAGRTPTGTGSSCPEGRHDRLQSHGDGLGWRPGQHPHRPVPLLAGGRPRSAPAARTGG
ncbi:serine hydrolase [Micromonospora sp. 050-3]|uniref:serine hydrolase n=1 Tax=Micromonospora sp. 050-3 TaxID=2789265 RepID=UPI00397D65D6